jgi:DNA-binding FrmR family transcriptional regulator
MPRPTTKTDDDAPAVCGCEAHARPRHAAGVDPEIKAAGLRRLRRIEGQVRGLQRMIAEDRYCPDILTQVASVQEALRAVARGLTRNHLKHCVAAAHGTSRADAVYEELLDLVYKQAR